MIIKKFSQEPLIKSDKKYCVEFYDKQIGQEPKLVEKKYFSELKEALKYMDEERWN